MQITIIGCGYVGLVTGACLAELGHSVMGVDNNPDKIRCLKALKVPIFEPGLDGLISTHCQEGRLKFSTEISEGVKHGEVIFICVNTPPKDDGSVDLSSIDTVCREIAMHMDSYRLIVEKSTVPVRTGERVTSIIKEYAPAGLEFDVASNPEFLREGTAISDFLRPDRVVIGTASQKASTLLVSLYEPLNAPLLLTDVYSAELIKHSANAFLALKISFINSVAAICDLSGADIAKVTKGIGLDHRIGMASLNPGIGYGGMCLPKDVSAYIEIARELGFDFELLRATQNVNKRQRLWPVEQLKNCLPSLKGVKLAILGLSFKPNTDDLRFAPAIEIIKALHEAQAEIYAYDPVSCDAASLEVPYVQMCHDAYEACTNAQGVVICTEWDEFRHLNLPRIKRLVDRPLIIDGRNIFEPFRMLAQGFEYHCVGRPTESGRV